jgi:hypothetical protein
MSVRYGLKLLGTWLASTALRRGLNGRCTSKSQLEPRPSVLLMLSDSLLCTGHAISMLCRGVTATPPFMPDASSEGMQAAPEGLTMGLSN